MTPREEMVERAVDIIRRNRWNESSTSGEIAAEIVAVILPDIEAAALERAAKAARKAAQMGEILLHLGEMTRSERKIASVIAAYMLAKIEALKPEPSP